MATTYTEVCRRLPDGALVRVEAPPWAELRFNGVTRQAPGRMLQPRAAASRSRTLVVGTHHSNDHAYVVNDLGISMQLCTAHGQQAEAIEYRPDTDVFEAYVVDTSTSMRRFILTGDLSLLNPEESAQPIRIPLTSQGIRDLRNGVVALYPPFSQRHDVTSFGHYLDRGIWTSGQADRKNRVGLFDHTNRKALISNWHTVLPPRMAIDVDGLPVVAVSDDMGGRFLNLSDFVDYSLPLRTDIVPTKRPFLTGMFSFRDAAIHPDYHGTAVPIRPNREFLKALGSRFDLIVTTDDHGILASDEIYGFYAGEDGTTGDSFGVAYNRSRETANRRGTYGVFAYAEVDFPREEDVARLRPGDTYLLRCFLNHDESPEAFLIRISAASAYLAARGIRIVGLIGVHRRIDPQHPQGLPKRDLCEVVACCSEIAHRDDWFGALGFRIFGLGATDTDFEALAYLNAWFLSSTDRRPPRPHVPQTPIPDPKPQEPTMIWFVDRTNPAPAPAADAPAPVRYRLWGEKMPLPDGKFWVKKPNGKAATLNPNGGWEERDTHLGFWETFQNAKPAGTFADRRDGKAFFIETIED